jgi:hypothetical protein
VEPCGSQTSAMSECGPRGTGCTVEVAGDAGAFSWVGGVAHEAATVANSRAARPVAEKLRIVMPSNPFAER